MRLVFGCFFHGPHPYLCGPYCIVLSYCMVSIFLRWETLWSGPPQQAEAEHKYRVFKPPLKEIDYPTKLVLMKCNELVGMNVGATSL